MERTIVAIDYRQCLRAAQLDPTGSVVIVASSEAAKRKAAENELAKSELADDELTEGELLEASC